MSSSYIGRTSQSTREESDRTRSSSRDRRYSIYNQRAIERPTANHDNRGRKRSRSIDRGKTSKGKGKKKATSASTRRRMERDEARMRSDFPHNRRHLQPGKLDYLDNSGHHIGNQSPRQGVEFVGNSPISYNNSDRRSSERWVRYSESPDRRFWQSYDMSVNGFSRYPGSSRKEYSSNDDFPRITRDSGKRISPHYDEENGLDMPDSRRSNERLTMLSDSPEQRFRQNSYMTFCPSNSNNADLRYSRERERFGGRQSSESDLEYCEWRKMHCGPARDSSRKPDGDWNGFSSVGQDDWTPLRRNEYDRGPRQGNHDENHNYQRNNLSPLGIDHTEALDDQLQSEEFEEELVAEIMRIVLKTKYTTRDTSTVNIMMLARRDLTGITFSSLRKFTTFLRNQEPFFELTQNNGSVLIIPKTDIQVCHEYVKKTNATKNSCENCQALHICKFFLFGTCSKHEKCNLGHDLFSDHNVSVLRHARLHRTIPMDVKLLMSEPRNRNLTTLPVVCKFYNNQTTCNKEACPHLHICRHFVENDCKFRNSCKRNHSLSTTQCEMILQRFGLHLDTESEEQLLHLLMKTLSDKSVCRSRYYKSNQLHTTDRTQTTTDTRQTENSWDDIQMMTKKSRTKSKMAKREKKKREKRKGYKTGLNKKLESKNMISSTWKMAFLPLHGTDSPSTPTSPTYRPTAPIYTQTYQPYSPNSNSPVDSTASLGNGAGFPRKAPASPRYTITSPSQILTISNSTRSKARSPASPNFTSATHSRDYTLSSPIGAQTSKSIGQSSEHIENIHSSNTSSDTTDVTVQMQENRGKTTPHERILTDRNTKENQVSIKTELSTEITIERGKEHISNETGLTARIGGKLIKLERKNDEPENDGAESNHTYRNVHAMKHEYDTIKRLLGNDLNEIGSSGIVAYSKTTSVGGPQQACVYRATPNVENVLDTIGEKSKTLNKFIEDTSMFDNAMNEITQTSLSGLQVCGMAGEIERSKIWGRDLARREIAVTAGRTVVPNEDRCESTECDDFAKVANRDCKMIIYNEEMEHAFTCQNGKWHMSVDNEPSQPVDNQFVGTIAGAYEILLQTSRTIINRSVTNDAASLQTE